jgi:hypothetical protein
VARPGSPPGSPPRPPPPPPRPPHLVAAEVLVELARDAHLGHCLVPALGGRALHQPREEGLHLRQGRVPACSGGGGGAWDARACPAAASAGRASAGKALAQRMPCRRLLWPGLAGSPCAAPRPPTSGLRISSATLADTAPYMT